MAEETKERPETVCIVKHRLGWVAHVRYKAQKHGVDLSHTSKERLYALVASHFQ